MQSVPHRMTRETHLTRVDGDSVLVLRVIAQDAGYVGPEFLDFHAAAAEDPYQ
jgi:hypothetical protein